MNYENNFYKLFQQYSNPNSEYYGKAFSNLRGTLNASSPTTNSLLGMMMAMGGSYKGSLTAANKQRKAIETRNSETAQQGMNQLYTNSQGQALNALQGAQSAYEYKDSQPGFMDYLAGPLSSVAGYLTGGILGGSNNGGSGMTGGRSQSMSASSWASKNGAGFNTALPVGYRRMPTYDPFNY